MGEPGPAHVPALLEQRSRRYPDLPAVSVNDDPPLTYRSWWTRAVAVAAGLHGRVAPGAVLALPFPARRWAAYAVAYVGCQLAAAVPALVRATMPAAEWAELAPLLDGVLTPTPGTSVAGIPAANQFTLDSLHPAPGAAGTVPGPGPIAHVVFTSGTTGTPKAIAVQHAELLDGSDLPAAWAGTALFHVMAPHATAGTEGALMLALKSGMHATTVSPAEPDRLVRRLTAPDTRVALMVPSVAQLVVGSGLLPARVEQVRLVMLMGSAAPPAVLHRLSRHFPRGRVLSHYGATEAGAAQLLMPYDRARPFAAGRAVGRTEVRIVRDGVDVPAGEIGEVLLRRRGTPQRRYLDRDAATFAADGWVHTGDLGRLDPDGYLFLLGRLKDIVIRGGQNIVPAETEQALLGLDGVQDAAAFGVPHDQWGEMLVAAVVMAPGRPFEPAALRRALRASLPPFKVPSRIFPITAVPRSAAGKPDKQRLREGYAELFGPPGQPDVVGSAGPASGAT